MRLFAKETLSRRFALFACAALALAALSFVAPRYAFAAYTYDGPIDTSWYSENQDEFTLTRADQLAGLAYLCSQRGVTFEGKTILLDNDLDISAHEWEPIGNPYEFTKVFMGTFDGQSHTISGLTIKNDEQNQSLFGSVKRAEIKNLTLEGSVTACKGAAGFVSYADRSQLSNLTNYCNVSALGATPSYNDEKSYNGDAAGVVAYSVGFDNPGESLYENLVNYGSIRATSSAGSAGTVGFLVATNGYTYRLVGCENHGSVYIAKAENVEDLTDGAGGVLGATSEEGTYIISNCANTGNVASNNLGSVGGVVGSVHGTNSQIDHSSNTGSITNLGTTMDAPTNDTPTAAGVVSQFESAGGTVSNNYSSGSISASTGYSAAIIGATSGDISEIASNNYYLEDSSTGAFNDQVTGASSDQIMAGSSATAEQLEQLMDSEQGGVKDIDYSQYTFTEITMDDEEEEAANEIDEQQYAQDLTMRIAIAVLVCVLVFGGALFEGAQFNRQRTMKEAWGE